MSDLPSRVHITEEGPREGFQFEKGEIPTARKIELIDALSTTGIGQIQVVSFVHPKAVPQMADAEAVVAGIAPREGVEFIGLWLNVRGLERAMATGKLHLEGSIALTASETFLVRNQKRTFADNLAQQREMAAAYKTAGIPITRGSVMAAFGCNFEGRIPVERVVSQVGDILAVAEEQEERITLLNLSDTMGWATPRGIREVVGAVRERYPELEMSLHLHDTRGMGIANACAGLEMGVAHFDACVGGLGGCPFAGNRAAAGNVCTEDLVFLCRDLGIETGIDLDALIEVAALAEDIVGHPLPGSVKSGGALTSWYA
ncbi:hydroxymethylglutaryl-CoA lyase [Amaricoccus solimangrovi]|uniref:Hydroxymethylglutaryl-CoA lyase n=1 Tax=Amaricoccus solimangrovi TaxID=2589815 RepID=A0A501WF36_9RHOB|nr:hydroxymethylglutaryl-CoA lyase [Amaricoccus solimangrovi]TPE47105.1 hydroxymethylglutaryl-CoA lyase [Amaricoccus solimangrovi]